MRGAGAGLAEGDGRVGGKPTASERAMAAWGGGTSPFPAARVTWKGRAAAEDACLAGAIERACASARCLVGQRDQVRARLARCLVERGPSGSEWLRRPRRALAEAWRSRCEKGRAARELARIDEKLSHAMDVELPMVIGRAEERRTGLATRLRTARRRCEGPAAMLAELAAGEARASADWSVAVDAALAARVALADLGRGGMRVGPGIGTALLREAASRTAVARDAASSGKALRAKADDLEVVHGAALREAADLAAGLELLDAALARGWSTGSRCWAAA